MNIVNILNRYEIFLTDDILLSFLSVLIAFFFVVLGFRVFVKILEYFKLGYQPIRNDGPASHIDSKTKTLTLGGVLIFLAMFITTLSIYNKVSPVLWCVFFIYISNFLLGAYDDITKLVKKNSKGISARYKLLVQFAASFIVIYCLSTHYPEDFDGFVNVPFFDMGLNLGIFYYLFAAIVIVGSSNAVNLSDGLDGLASYCLIPVLLFFYLIIKLSEYNHLLILSDNFYQDLKDINLIILIVFGALLGFLWWNCNPAKIFMGDVGSLPLGALIGYLAIITKTEILLVILGGIFVMEAFSVIIQVCYYKYCKKRVFKMAPIHHHFELSGIKENVIVTRFFLSGIILSLFCLMITFG
ncbi:MAG: phospho-N-acetylmuramoyl-pentapeptide-transferase [Rickettsiales bacterium]|nr:phospho-N-acetylmuramoyl-pentapeptide-transferase [Rickettsiales bacterium]